MKIGNVLLLKLPGIDKEAESCGIYLKREKGGKEHLYVVFTHRGTLKLKRKFIRRADDSVRYGGDTSDRKAMSVFLKEYGRTLEKRATEKVMRLEMTPETILRQVKAKALWRSVVNHAAGRRSAGADGTADIELPSHANEGVFLFTEPVSTDVIAGIHFHPKLPGRAQIDAVGEILKPSREKGAPYFERGGRGNRFNVFTADAMKGAESHIALLNRLKGLYVEWVEEEIEAPPGGESTADDGPVTPKEAMRGRGHRSSRKSGRKRKVPRLLADDPGSVTGSLGHEERNALAQLATWAREFFERGGWEKVESLGLGGTPVTRLDRFSLPRYIEFFGCDIAGERSLESPSALLEFLLCLDFISLRDASELLLEWKIARRDVHFSLSFPGPVLDEAMRLPSVPSREDHAGRVDIRSHECYTIDPADAKDFDDAVGFREFTDPGNGREMVEMHVHIADVTHYVRPGSFIDQEARRRCTSVYLPTGVLPMLPPQLSENLCSLRSGEDRLAFTTRMLFDAGTAELVECEHFRSVIAVRENLSYEHVNGKIAEEPDSLFGAMSRFSEKLAERHRRLDIVTEERKIGFTDDGNRLDVRIKIPSPATRMIEQFMVVTNEAVGRSIHGAGLPSVYRIHPLPDRPDVERWNDMCAALGHGDAVLDIDFDTLKRASADDGDEGGKGTGKGPKKEGDLLSILQSGGTLTFGGSGGPVAARKETRHEPPIKDSIKDSKDEKGETDDAGETSPGAALLPMDPGDLAVVGDAYRKTLTAIAGKDGPTRRLLYDRMLSTMARAAYTDHNHGHFGLNSTCYTHFTSPIRRYTDVLVHRVLAALVENGGNGRSSEKSAASAGTEDNGGIEDIGDKREEGNAEGIGDKEEIGDIEGIVELCNEQSRSAEGLERHMIDVALATRASRDREFRKGSHRCTISGLTPTSCFLSLDGAIEGRIPLSRMSSYRLALDESKSRIVMDGYDNQDVTDERTLKDYLEKMRGAVPATGPGGDEEETELFRLGQQLRCRIFSVDIAEGKVELSLAGRI